MSKIHNLIATEILDSRGNPTVEVLCVLDSGAQGTASVPSGASTGAHEACELRDGDMTMHMGKGVQKALGHIQGEILQCVQGKELDQEMLDDTMIELDGTPNKNRLGANALLAVSLAFARACTNEKKVALYEHLADMYRGVDTQHTYTLPTPAFNVINGGKHSDSGISFQEFMLIPVGFATCAEKVAVAEHIVETLKALFVQYKYGVSLGDEGGFAPKLPTNEQAFDYLKRAITQAGYTTGQVKLGVDVASTTFYKNDAYVMEGSVYTSAEMIKHYEKLIQTYPIISLEDGLQEDDFIGFALLNKKLGNRVCVVGDDLTVTNTERIQKAIDMHAVNTVLIKPNQIGTLSETFHAIRLAKENNMKVFISHRSGETEDTFIADLAVAVGADFIKAGAPTKKERIVKYERLIEIEKEIS